MAWERRPPAENGIFAGTGYETETEVGPRGRTLRMRYDCGCASSTTQAPSGGAEYDGSPTWCPEHERKLDEILSRGLL